MTILLLALAHIAPLIICRYLTPSRPALLTVAVLSATVGATVGVPAYAAVDVAAVFLGVYFLWPRDSHVQPEEPPPPRSASPSPEPLPARPRIPKMAANLTPPMEPAKWVDLSPKPSSAIRRNGIAKGAVWGAIAGIAGYLLFGFVTGPDAQFNFDMVALLFFLVSGAVVGALALRH